MLTVALPLVRGTGDSALASAPHYTLGLYPFSIPPYQTSTVELITTADSPGIAQYDINIDLGANVRYLNCTATSQCMHYTDPSGHQTIEFLKGYAFPITGILVLGTVTIAPNGASGSTALSTYRGEIEAFDPNGVQLGSSIDVINSVVIATNETVTPVALPLTGGPPGSADSTAGPIGEALLGGVMALGAAFAIGRRALSGLGALTHNTLRFVCYSAASDGASS